MKQIAIVIALLVAAWPCSAEILNRENLAAYYAALVRARDLGEPINIHIVGDSRVTSPADLDYQPAGIIAAAAFGHPISITFEVFGGQNSYLWANGEAADFLAERPDVDLLIVYFGENEHVAGATGGAQTLSQTDANFRAAHDLVRASRSADVLSILYVGGTPANNWAIGYDQTTAVMVGVNAVLAAVALDKEAAFFDPLAIFQRAHAEAGWQDQLPTPTYGDGNVHPLEPMNLALWGAIAADLFPVKINPVQAATISAPALLNGWLPWSAGYGPRAVLLPNGHVVLNGLIKPGTTTSLTPVFTLPAGYRPASNRFYRATTGAGGDVELQVLANGTVRFNGTFAGTYISLDGISFLAF